VLQSRIERATLTPEMFGIRRARLEELKGGDPSQNARTAQEVLSGRPGPVREAVIFNAAAALYVAGAASDLEEGLPLAAEAIDRGRARSVLEKVRKLTNE
jgi:anthranilate phosphoribosyltransferase